MRKLSILLVAALMISVLAACGQSASPSASTTPSTSASVSPSNSATASPEVSPSQATAKDKLTVVIPTDVSKFSPYYTMTHADIYLVYQIYERLVYYKGSEVVSGLAESWDVSEDGKTFTFHLRPDTYFHNGDKLTAEDVVFSINTNLERPSQLGNKAKFVRIEAVDENTVEIEMSYPMPAVYSLLASPGMGVINKAYVEEKGDDAYMEPVGTGAYKLKSWNKGSSVELEAFEDYNGTPAAIKYLTFTVIPDQNTAVVALETGNVDLIINATATNVNLLLDNPNTEMANGASHTSAKLHMNVRNGVTENQALRHAIAYAIDREAINIVAYEERGEISTGMFKDFMFYSGADFSYEYDPEKAKAILDENGLSNISLTIKTSESYGSTVPQLIQQDLSKIGIEVKIESLEMNAHSQDYLAGNFELLYTANSSIIPDVGEALYSIYHSPENATYFHAPAEPVLNEALDAARLETDPARKTAMFDEILGKVKEIAGTVDLVNGESNLVFAKGLKGVYIDPNGMFYCFKDFSW